MGSMLLIKPEEVASFKTFAGRKLYEQHHHELALLDESLT
jgi:hypothetical protein